ncbi:MAG: hypothetical protein CME62_17350 [Halobacteriovoraceae bacterium]|nr:hypothetical protein [Halobacteriovoraceae bacterium]|tara:strand:+ start:8042 stop:10096 length:2055 start_codon:yes stop_codon:yes gene_type:complete
MSHSHEYNYLREESSAYLKQHNQNPVKWYTYGPEALQKAQDEDKPLFVSVGYSSCHWCHVMAEESFEDTQIANYLNDNFINIKVDREELPDLDNYLQLACQVVNGRGGWPLNAFLTPEFKPYFIGTYFPKNAQEGIPSFKDVIQNMSQAYQQERETVLKNSEQISETLKQKPTFENKVEFEGHYPGAASVLNALKNYQDEEYGGYGQEPKFPHFSFYEWAIEHILEGMVPEELGKHIVMSVEKMLMGGIYDQARGGIHRYSVDKKWLVPHFEKMLYDQAGLLKMLSKTSLLYPSPLIFDSIMQTLDFLNKEMLAEKGYFFSAQDAESEGVEGLYFTFTKDEFLDALKNEDETLLEQQDKILSWFNISDQGNFERGLNVISLNSSLKNEMYAPENWEIVRKTKKAILSARKDRIPPATDTKGIASWNFQLMSALIDVIQYTKIDAIRNQANSMLVAIHQSVVETFLYQDDEKRTRIHTSTTRGEHVPLFEDYVMFCEFSFRCFELTGDMNFLANAEQTVHYIMKDFFKDDFFYTRSLSFNDSEYYPNIHTPIFDQSYKSALATFVILLRKWKLSFTDFNEYLKKLEPTLETLTHLSLQNPLAFGETLRALVYPPEAYRLIEVPRKWYEENKIQQFFINFSVRFALKAHAEDNENWQICNHKECELRGVGFEEFKNVFTPKENSAE